jgi:RNA polymerase sigma-70 factor (ECF subfamily)
MDRDADHAADRADITASLAANGEAYRRIVGRHQSSIARRMRRFAASASEIEELVQDVFVEAYFSLAKFSGRAPFEHWLNRIATRVGYAHLKQRLKWKKRSGDAQPLEQLASAEPPSAAEAADALHHVLDRLGPRDRLVITLLHLENRTVAETASLTGWSQAMVKVQAYRARSKLRKLLEASA